MRFYGRGVRPSTVGNNHGGLTTFSDCATRSIGDYTLAIFDEVALEGLDGITMQALSLRLNSRDDFEIPLDTQPQMDWLFSVLLERARHSYGQDLMFYRLPKPRIPLVVYNRYDHMDGELGVVIEPETLPADPCPFKLVEDNTKGIKGSCCDYKTREDVTSDLLNGKGIGDLGGYKSLRDVSKYICGDKVPSSNEDVDDDNLNRLVVVASQRLRNQAILGKYYDPLLFEELSGLQWAILERIGRARYLGEATQGKGSLSNITKIPPKTLFYHMKDAMRMGLICKQHIYQKIRGMNAHGNVFSLPRFYVQRKSKSMLLTYNVIKLLKTKPNMMALYPEVMEALNLTQQSIKKLYKHTHFRSNIRSDVRVPHRFLYPEAEEHEWKTKGHGEERQYRVMELINKDMDPEDFWLQDRKDENEESSVGIDDDEDDKLDGPLRTVPYDKSRIVLERSMAWQAYRLLKDAGTAGLTQSELGMKMGVPKLEARSIYRYLQRSGVTIQYTLDQGRQRSYKLVSKEYEGMITATDQLEAERSKMHELKV